MKLAKALFALTFLILLMSGATLAQISRDSTELNPIDMAIGAEMLQLEQATQLNDIHAVLYRLRTLHRMVLEAETPDKLKYLRFVAQSFEKLDKHDPNNISYKKALIECLEAEHQLTHDADIVSKLIKRYEEAILIVYKNYSDQELEDWAGLLLKIDLDNEHVRLLLGKRFWSRHWAVIALIILLPVLSYAFNRKAYVDIER